ncbi:MAG TPA: hypothetical protein VE650_10680 [Acetobacteraceae bacterium]|nr:hypothetical protein [Acetobacteraceae bacterium]
MASPAPPPPTGFDPLTGIKFTQYAPVANAMVDWHAWWIIAEFAPIGGIGPFTFGLGKTNPAGYMMAYDNTYGLIRTPYGGAYPAGTSDRLELWIKDATGKQVTTHVTIDRSAASPILAVSGPFQRPSNQDWRHTSNQVRAAGPGHGGGDALALASDPSKLFEIAYGAIAPAGMAHGHAAAIPPGSYTVTVTATSAAGVLSATPTFTYRDAQIGPASIAWNAFSDSVPAGFVLGTFMCSTPNNRGSYALKGDTSGAVSLDTRTREIKATRALQAGDFTLSIEVTDTGLTKVFQFPLHVPKGVKLDPGKMRFRPNPNLDNSRLNQSVGTPEVEGIPNGKWYLQQSCMNPIALLAFGYPNPAPYAQDATTGAVTNTNYLSAQAVIGRPHDVLTFTKTDGSTTCTASFPVPVKEAPEKLIWVGPGMAAAHPGSGFDTWAAAGPTLSAPHPGWTHHVKLIGHDYVGDYWWTITGPLWIEPVAGPKGEHPRFGGPRSNDQNGGYKAGTGKGCLLFGPGDARVFSPRRVPLEIAYVHGGRSTDGREAIRKEGSTSGNLWLDAVDVHDCDMGFLVGACHSTIKVTRSRFANCGTAHQSAGNLHNVYVNSVNELIFEDSVSHDASQGHLLKSRAKVTRITRSRFWEGLNSDAVCMVDVPDYGEVYIDDKSFFRKGASPFNPSIINIGAEYDAYVNNWLTSSGSTFELMPCSYGLIVGNYWRQNAVGESARVTMNNPIFFIPPKGTGRTPVLGQYETRNFTANQAHPPLDTTPSHQPVLNNVTLATLPAKLDASCPWGPGECAVPGPLFRKFNWGDERGYPNFNRVQQVSDRHEIRLAHHAPPGTVINKVYATGDGSGYTGWVNPFGPGTKWIVVSSNNVAWYGFKVQDDGSTAFLYEGGAAGPMIDLVVVRAIGPTGTLCDNRYPVVFT